MGSIYRIGNTLIRTGAALARDANCCCDVPSENCMACAPEVYLFKSAKAVVTGLTNHDCNQCTNHNATFFCDFARTHSDTINLPIHTDYWEACVFELVLAGECPFNSAGQDYWSFGGIQVFVRHYPNRNGINSASVRCQILSQRQSDGTLGLAHVTCQKGLFDGQVQCDGTVYTCPCTYGETSMHQHCNAGSLANFLANVSADVSFV